MLLVHILHSCLHQAKASPQTLKPKKLGAASLVRMAEYHLGVCVDCAILSQWGVVGRQIHVCVGLFCSLCHKG